MNYYILISSPAQQRTGEMSRGYDVAIERLEKGIWPMFQHTRNRKQIAAGDRCLIYISGSESTAQHVVASATVVANKETRSYRDEYYYDAAPSNLISLTNAEVFKSPISLKDIIQQLTICPKNAVRWGCALQGGARAISLEDYELITGTAG
jgi:predicted RNA-binding protein